MRPQRAKSPLPRGPGFRALDLSPPEALVELLNAYFGELTHLVRQTGGHVEYVAMR
jgi:hypothetical protein